MLFNSGNVIGDELPVEIIKIYIQHGLEKFNMHSFNDLKSKHSSQVPFFETYFSFCNGMWNLKESIPNWISMKKFEPPANTTNGYFSHDYEDNPNYYFHGTKRNNFASICKNGFMSKALQKTNRTCLSIFEQPNLSVSFADKSLLAKNYAPDGDGVIFMVEIIIPPELEAKNRELCKPTATTFTGGIDLYDLVNVRPNIIGYCFV